MRKEGKMSFPICRSQVFEQHFVGIYIYISLEIHDVTNLKRQQSHHTSIRLAVFTISSSIKIRLLARQWIFWTSLWKSLNSLMLREQRNTGGACDVTESTIKPFPVKVDQITKRFRVHTFVKLCTLYSFLCLLLFFSVFVFRNTTTGCKYPHSHMLVSVTQQSSHVLWAGAETTSNLILTDRSRNTYNRKCPVRITVPWSINCFLS